MSAGVKMRSGLFHGEVLANALKRNRRTLSNCISEGAHTLRVLIKHIHAPLEFDVLVPRQVQGLVMIPCLLQEQADLLGGPT